MRHIPKDLDESFFMIDNWHKVSDWIDPHDLDVMINWLNIKVNYLKTSIFR